MEGQGDQVPIGAGADYQHPGSKLLHKLESHVRRRIFGGFVVLIPLLATFLVLRFIVGYVDGFFKPMVDDTPLKSIPGIGLVFTLVLLYIVGVLVSAKAGRRAINWQDALLSRIPVVKSIYGVAKQAADAVTSPMGHKFSRVVFVEWPRPGYLSLGFVTGYLEHPAPDRSDPLIAIYIPTVPNPTSGMLTFVKESDIIETNLSMEDAMKAVFSGGIVLPEAYRAKPHPTLPQR